MLEGEAIKRQESNRKVVRKTGGKVCGSGQRVSSGFIGCLPHMNPTSFIPAYFNSQGQFSDIFIFTYCSYSIYILLGTFIGYWMNYLSFSCFFSKFTFLS